MPKPFNPPRNSNLALRKPNLKKGEKTKSATCKPLPNPSKNLIKNTIIGDSLYSEDENSENMDSFESSESL